MRSGHRCTEYEINIGGLVRVMANYLHSMFEKGQPSNTLQLCEERQSSTQSSTAATWVDSLRIQRQDTNSIEAMGPNNMSACFWGGRWSWCPT